jgi:hypothetical protein
VGAGPRPPGALVGARGLQRSQACRGDERGGDRDCGAVPTKSTTWRRWLVFRMNRLRVNSTPQSLLPVHERLPFHCSMAAAVPCSRLLAESCCLGISSPAQSTADNQDWWIGKPRQDCDLQHQV